MVLAAGKGTRLRPLTDVLPKPLCEVAGVPLIRLALRQLQAAGVTRAVINLHHLGGLIEAHLGAEAEGVALQYSREQTILGTGGGIRAALPLLGEAPFYVVNADALQDVDLPGLASVHQTSGAVATLTLREDPNAARFGVVGTDDAGRIRRMVDQFDDGGATRSYMFTGVHIMDHRVVRELPLGEERCVIRQGYVPLLKTGGHLHAYVHGGAFHDVGTPERWSHAQRRVLDGAEKNILALATQGLEQRAPGVWVHASVNTLKAQLVAPAIVHADVRIGDGATLGPAVALGRAASVAAGSRVTRSAVLAGQRVEGVVEDVVVGADTRLTWPDG